MNWIQVLLIVAIVTLVVYLLRSRRSAQARAWVKVGYVVFVMALLDLRRATAPRFHAAGRAVIGLMVLFIGVSAVRPHWSLEFDRVGVALFRWDD